MDNIKNIHKVFNLHAQAYQNKYMELSHYHESFDLFCEHLEKPTARILDVGCGPGNISKYLFSKNATYGIKGIDISENMIALATANNPKGTYIVGIAGVYIISERHLMV